MKVRIRLFASLRKFGLDEQEVELADNATITDAIDCLKLSPGMPLLRIVDIGETFPQVVWHSEVPLLRTAPVPLCRLSKLVRQNDFKVVLTSVKEKKPELIYFGGIYPEGGLLVKQARELGIRVRFMSGDGVIDPFFVQIAGAEAAEGTYLTFSPDAKNISSAGEFIKKYEAAYGEMGPYSIYAYDAANMLLSAVKEANSSDGKAIADTLHAMTYHGALGTIQFDAKGDVTVSPYVVWITRKGKFEELWKP